ncbi:MAG TPA: long-chain fatty acid--CoA ligase [Polyangiaceae bacterium]|jgi:long-chain acyl-CoA synthetase
MAKNLVQIWKESCDQFAGRPLFGNRTASGWVWTTYATFAKLVDDFRGGLARLGVGAGDRVAIVSNNRVEWAVAAYATYGLRASFVPMYEVQHPTEWEFIIQDCKAKIAIGSSSAVYQQLREIAGRVACVEQVVGIELAPEHEHAYRRLLKLGADFSTAAQDPDEEEIAGLLYTSGTTGKPKGVILSHRNVCSNVFAVRDLFGFGPDDRSLSFLYWAHSFGQVCELHVLLSKGASMAINDDVNNLLRNLAEVKPTILVSVPRIFNRIYDNVQNQIREKPAPIQSLFHSAIRAANKKGRGERIGALEQAALLLADKLIFKKIRAKVGGQLKLAVSGSAALSKEVAEFIDALGIQVYEGYGLSETSPVVSVNVPGHRKFGSVGKPVPGVSVTIDQQAMGDAADGSQGEIVVRGPNVMKGYYGLPEETRQVLREDGSFRTGDTGYLDQDGYLFITGRIKEQYKLENGKYVAPAPLEEQLKLSPYITNVMIYGANRPHNVALVVPDSQALQKWAAANAVELGDMAQNPKVRTLLSDEIAKLGTSFKSFEKPKGFAVVPEDFTIENDLLTPSLKLKRRNVLAKYGAEIDALYR